MPTERREHFGSLRGRRTPHRLRMRLNFADGSHRVGEPTVWADSDSDEVTEYDDTGVTRELGFDGLPVDIAEIAAYAVLCSE